MNPGFQAPISFVLFDFGNVIAEFNNVWFLERLLGAGHPGIPELLPKIFAGNGLSHRFEIGSLTVTEFQTGVERVLGKAFPAEHFTAAYCEIFRPVVPTLDLIRFLKNKVRIGLLSNTNALHFERVIKPMPEFALFDQVTVSFEVGAMKPSRRIFEDALEKFGGNPAEVLYLDDVPGFVAGARQTGIQALLFDNPPVICAQVKQFFTV